MKKEIRKEIANVLIIFIAIFLVAFGLKFKPSLRFVEFIFALILPVLIILKFGEVFSKTEVLASIFVTGLIVNAYWNNYTPDQRYKDGDVFTVFNASNACIHSIRICHILAS